MSKNSLQFKILSTSAFFALCFVLSACGPITPCVNVDAIQISVDNNANNDSATEVDLVFAYNEALAKELIGLSAEKYFERTQQLQRDHPSDLHVFHWEVVPGQVLKNNDLEYPRSCPAAGIVFARYHSPGEHRINVGSEDNILVHLMKRTFEVTPVASSWSF